MCSITSVVISSGLSRRKLSVITPVSNKVCKTVKVLVSNISKIYIL